MFKKYVPKPGRREYITFLILFLEIVLFGIFAPNFLTVSNLVRVVQNNAEIAIVSIGMTIVMLLGGIDLSVGSVMGVIAIVIGYMLQGRYKHSFDCGCGYLYRHWTGPGQRFFGGKV